LRAQAEARGESLNTTVLRLLTKAVGIDERRQRLERYATWTAADQAEFDEALAAQRVVEPDLWK
jgi:hypothetical protein